jgi:hypothetical protein
MTSQIIEFAILNNKMGSSLTAELRSNNDSAAPHPSGQLKQQAVVSLRSAEFTILNNKMGNSLKKYVRLPAKLEGRG